LGAELLLVRAEARSSVAKAASELTCRSRRPDIVPRGSAGVAARLRSKTSTDIAALSEGWRRVEIRSRNDKDLTALYPRLAAAATCAVVVLLALCSSCAPLPYADIPSASPANAKAVVFDMDGTLTPSVSAVFEVRKDAAEAVRAYAAKGYKIIYLSTRVSWLSGGVPYWLKENGFPEGSVHVAQTRNEHSQPDVYKTAVLRAYVAHGWSLKYAYGDSSTDLAAYAAVGIPKEHVFVLLRKGESTCQPGTAAACLGGWTEHLGFVSSVRNANED